MEVARQRACAKIVSKQESVQNSCRPLRLVDSLFLFAEIYRFSWGYHGGCKA